MKCACEQLDNGKIPAFFYQGSLNFVVHGYRNISIDIEGLNSSWWKQVVKEDNLLKAPADYQFTVVIKADPQDVTMICLPDIGELGGAANQEYNIPKESIKLVCAFTAEDVFRKLDGYTKLDGNTVTGFI